MIELSIPQRVQNGIDWLDSQMERLVWFPTQSGRYLDEIDELSRNSI
jgi:hypothetical protein